MIRTALLMAVLATGQGPYHWAPYTEPEYAHWVGLWSGPAQVGAWDRKAGEYRPLTDRAAGTWGPAGPPPVPVPAHLETWPAAGPKNFGIEVEKLGHGYSINGKPATRKEAYEFLQKRTLDDDSRRLRLTVIGTADECRRVLDDLADPKVKAHLGDAIVATYRPDHWHVDGVFEPGAPSIYFQKPGGEVLARLASYPGKAVFSEVLRKGHPDYDPGKDRDADDLTRPAPGPAGPAGGKLKFDLAAVPSYLWAVGGFLVAFLFLKRGS